MTSAAISALWVRAGRVGGAEQMIGSLLRGLDEVTKSGEHWRVLVRESIPGARNLNSIEVKQRHSAFLAPNRALVEMCYLPRERDVDAWLLPNYLTVPGLNGRTTTVIHDALYAHHPHVFSPSKRAWLKTMHTFTLRRADAVVAISSFVANDLVRLYGAKFASKIHVIHNPVIPPSGTGEVLPTGFSSSLTLILCVSAHYRHKNLPTLLKAFSHLAPLARDTHLVLVGQIPDQLVGVRGADPLIGMIRSLGLENRVTVTGFVPTEQLDALYAAASMAVVPSLFEGFGLPAVEALLAGLPTITTRCGSLPEVGMGLTVEVTDPLDDREMADKMLTVLKDTASFAPSPSEIERVREHYRPARIGALYREVLLP